jgi:hypothetical protein
MCCAEANLFCYSQESFKKLKISEWLVLSLHGAYEQDLMVFYQYCLDYFTKVRSQAFLCGLKHSLRPSGALRQRPAQVWLWGEGAGLL